VHDIPIVGGYWGYANVRNRNLGLYFFKVLTNAIIANFYNKVKHEKGQDQYLLTDFMSKYSLANSTTHDSFSCQEINGDPWPTQRQGNCFVGCSGCCNQSIEFANQIYTHVCPNECRPKQHQDWIFC
jgi:hypothetical protein